MSVVILYAISYILSYVSGYMTFCDVCGGFHTVRCARACVKSVYEFSEASAAPSSACVRWV